jgi:tetraacyldisaccharide 4'-kinase
MDLDVLILDDSYQHRAIKPGMNLLLTDYNDPFSKILFCRLVTFAKQKRKSRADIIMVTKCPDDLTEEKKQYYISRIRPQHYQKVFFSSIAYDENILGINKMMPVKNLDYYDVLLITGIANPSSF